MFEIRSLEESSIIVMRDKGILMNPYIFDPSRLRIINISYYDSNFNIKHDGEIMVLDVIAEDVVAIFKEIFDRKFPINKIRLIDEYNGSDYASMADNNSSALNQRNIFGTDILSIHSYGLAIDINPLQNPMILHEEDGTVKFYPKESEIYADRRNINDNPFMVEHIKDIFYKYGFVWGGGWDNPLDYHHFQLPRDVAESFF